MSEWLESSRLWQGAGMAVATIIGLPVWRRLFPKPHHMKMGWLDWCGYYACIGVLYIIGGKVIGWDSLLLAGGLLLLPLFPIAILGILGKLDDTFTDIVDAIRKR